MSDIEECAIWMEPFVSVVKSQWDPAVKTFEGIADEDMLNIQTHPTDLAFLVSRPTNHNSVYN